MEIVSSKRLRYVKHNFMSSPCGSQQEAYVLGMKVNTTTYSGATALIHGWADRGDSRYVCIATVNNVMESYDSPAFRQVMNGADLITSDGMPVVWALWLLGRKHATRVYGPDLTPILLQRAAESGVPVGFYGGAPHVLERLVQVVVERFPGIHIAYSYSPPFRPMTPEEDEGVVSAINASGPKLLFVGLNTPKQDHWMAMHRGKVQAVMVGVGAAFDFLAGSKPQAPRWMMGIGLEWLFRLITEPRRLWKRYLKHNPRFVLYFILQLAGLRQYRHEPAVGK